MPSLARLAETGLIPVGAPADLAGGAVGGTLGTPGDPRGSSDFDREPASSVPCYELKREENDEGSKTICEFDEEIYKILGWSFSKNKLCKPLFQYLVLEDENLS